MKNLQGQWSMHISRGDMLGRSTNKFFWLSSSCLCTNSLRSVHHAGNVHAQQVVSCTPVCLMGVSPESWDPEEGGASVIKVIMAAAVETSEDDSKGFRGGREWESSQCQDPWWEVSYPSVLRGCQMSFVQILTLQPEHRDRIHQGQASKYCQ